MYLWITFAMKAMKMDAISQYVHTSCLSLSWIIEMKNQQRRNSVLISHSEWRLRAFHMFAIVLANVKHSKFLIEMQHIAGIECRRR